MSYNVITVSPSRLGDTIFCTPVFRLWKEIFPDINIDVIALTSLAKEVLSDNPNIRHIFLAPEKSTLTSLANNYTFVINLHDSLEARDYLNLFSGKRINYSVDSYQNIHQTEKLIRFFGEYFDYDTSGFDGQYNLYPSEKHRENIKSLFLSERVDLSRNILIGFHMGCHGLAKRRTRLWNKFSHPKAWPLKKFIDLTKKLKLTNQEVRIVLTGSSAEEPLGKIFCKKFPDTINMIDRTSVLDLAVLMEYLKVFVSNDTGVLHIANATDVNIVALFGKSDPVETGPFPRFENRIVFHDKKIERISVQQVYAVLKKWIL